MNDAKRGIPIVINKGVAAAKSILPLARVHRVYLPFVYGENRRLEPIIADYDTVLRGQVLATPVESSDSPLTSPVSGVVVGMTTLHHPLYGELTCSVVDAVVSEPAEMPEMTAFPSSVTPKEILDRCQKANVIDEYDGVPLHLKLADWATEDTPLCLIADGTEPEPYQSSAYAVLKKYGRQVLWGLRLAATAANVPNTRIALQTSYARIRKLAAQFDPQDVHNVRRKRYPLFHTEPTEFRGKTGVIGVQACLALALAVIADLPQTDLVVTVAGDALDEPRNLLVPIGTPIEEALQACGVSKQVGQIIIGDALTGVRVEDRLLPILPGTTCLLALSDPPRYRVRSCIGCGACAAVCHKGLLPYDIARRYENMQYERLTLLDPKACDGCGACSAVCPARRPVAETVLHAAHSVGTIFVDWGDEP